MSVPDLGASRQRRVVSAPPQAALFANDVGLAVVTGGMIELRFRYYSEADGGQVQTVITQPVIIAPGLLAEVVGPNLKNVLMAAASQIGQDALALKQAMEALGMLSPAEDGRPSAEEMARRRREAGG